MYWGDHNKKPLNKILPNIGINRSFARNEQNLGNRSATRFPVNACYTPRAVGESATWFDRREKVRRSPPLQVHKCRNFVWKMVNSAKFFNRNRFNFLLDFRFNMSNCHFIYSANTFTIVLN